MAVTIEETFQRPVGELTADVNEKLLEAPINALRVTLYPDGLAGRITNLAEVRAAALASLQRQVAGTADPDLQDLYDELRRYAANDRLAQPGPAADEPTADYLRTLK